MATDDVGSYWVVTNLIGDFPVTTKEGDLSNASAKTFTRGAVEGGTVTATAATQLSHERGMEQRTLQVSTIENWEKGQYNPSGGGGGEDDRTPNPTMEDCVDHGGTMASGGLSLATVDQEALAGPQMEDVLVDSSYMTSERGSMMVGGLEEGAKVSTVTTEDVTWAPATPEDAITLHAGQSQQDREPDKEAEKQSEGIRQHLCTEEEDQQENKTDYSREVIIVSNQVSVIVEHKDTLTRVS